MRPAGPQNATASEPEPSRSRSEGRPLRRVGPWLLGLLLLLGLALSADSARRKSVTVDELGHLPSGVYFLTLRAGEVSAKREVILMK